MPRAVMGGLILTYNCSLRCRHCLHASGPEWREWASVEDIEKIASDLERACPAFAVHIVERTDEFPELAPRSFYSNLGPR